MMPLSYCVRVSHYRTQSVAGMLDVLGGILAEECQMTNAFVY